MVHTHFLTCTEKPEQKSEYNYGGLITLYNADFSVCLHPVIGAPSIPQ